MRNVFVTFDGNIPSILFAPPAEPCGRFQSLRCYNMQHHSVGGATTSSRTVWTQNWDFRGASPALSRQLGHLLDHSTLPSACAREPTFAHLTPDDLLPMATPLLPVVFPTHATRSKWGVRELTVKEIALCLDAPLWIVSNPVLLGLFSQRHKEGQVIPLKLLQAPLQAFLIALAPVSAGTSDPKVRPRVSSEDPRGSWLPLLDM